ncbi:hypothetical protein OROMI_030232 [Orobanche minor]
MMNSMKIPSKRSSTLEKKLDKLILALFTVLFCMCLLGSIGSYLMIKFIQSTQFINNDLRMYHAESNTPALTRTSNLNEELGQVDHFRESLCFLSTRGEVIDHNCFDEIAYVMYCDHVREIKVYGTSVSEIETGTAQRTGAKVDSQQKKKIILYKGKAILKNSVNDQNKVYEVSGRQSFRTEASYSFLFEDYNCTVEFFVPPFLVQEWEVTDNNGTKKETL